MRDYLFKGIILSLFVLVQSCDSVSYKSTLSAVKVDTLFFNVPFETSATLTNISIQEINQKETLIGFNYLTYSIDLYDFETRQYIESIKLEREGPNFVSGLRALSVIGGDRILIADNTYLTFIDFDGKVLSRIQLNGNNSEINGLDFSKCMLTVNRVSGLQYDEESQDVILEVYFFNSIKEKKYYPYLVKLNLIDFRARLVDLPMLSKEFKQVENYGGLNGVHFSRKNDTLIVCNKYSSNIAIISKDTVTRIKLNSEFTSNISNPLSAEMSNIEHKYNSPEFYNVVYDPWQKKYFRSHKSELDQKSGKSSFYLIVADEDFNRIDEYPLSSDYYIFPIVSKGGVLFSAIDRHDNKLEFLRYRLQ